MMLLGLHIVSIALLVAVVGSIAYQMGKKRGIEMMQIEYEEQPLDANTKETTSSLNPSPS